MRVPWITTVPAINPEGVASGYKGIPNEPSNDEYFRNEWVYPAIREERSCHHRRVKRLTPV